MPSLPRHDNSNPRDAWDLFVLQGIERLTISLRKGDAWNARSVLEIQRLAQRLNALQEAINYRLQIIEHEENDNETS